MEDAKTILVIEDEDSLLKVLSEIYEGEGFKVLSAADGNAGLKTALQIHPDLIVLDILLPKLSGIQLLKKLRQDAWGKSAEVIILTNLNDSKTVADALEYGVTAYFVKSDIDVDDVIKKSRERLKV
jgi:DNA-binding response OmpR family regulator